MTLYKRTNDLDQAATFLEQALAAAEQSAWADADDLAGIKASLASVLQKRTGVCEDEC